MTLMLVIWTRTQEKHHAGQLLPVVNLVFLLWFPILPSFSLSSSPSSSLPLFKRLLMMLLWWKGSRLKIRLRLIVMLRVEPLSPGMEAFPWNRPLAVGRNCCFCGCERKPLSSFFFSSCRPPSSSSFFFSSTTDSSSFSRRTGRLSERRHSGGMGRRLWEQDGWKPS